MSREQKPKPRGSRRPRFVLRSGADIGRFILHLATHWALPRVEVGIDNLPPLVAQRAQTRFIHIAEASDRQVLGLLVAGTTVMIGSVYLVWNWNRDWHSVVWLGIVALYAGVIGTIVSVTFSRFRLLLAVAWMLLKTRRLRKPA